MLSKTALSLGMLPLLHFQGLDSPHPGESLTSPILPSSTVQLILSLSRMDDCSGPPVDPQPQGSSSLATPVRCLGISGYRGTVRIRGRSTAHQSGGALFKALTIYLPRDITQYPGQNPAQVPDRAPGGFQGTGWSLPSSKFTCKGSQARSVHEK